MKKNQIRRKSKSKSSNNNKKVVAKAEVVEKEFDGETSTTTTFDPLDGSEHTEATEDTDDLLSEPSDELEVTTSTTTKVRFDVVQIREYERIVGDHPDTRVGVPISLGWKFYEQPSQDITKYEADRPPKKQNLRMSSITRKNLLQTVFDISEEEIRNGEVEVQRIKKLREKSNKQSNVAAKTESAMKNIRRKFKRAISFDKIVDGLAFATSSMASVAPTAGMMMPTISAY